MPFCNSRPEIFDSEKIVLTPRFSKILELSGHSLNSNVTANQPPNYIAPCASLLFLDVHLSLSDRDQNKEVLKGLSESEFMSRQRYLSFQSRSGSMASQPMHPALYSSVKIHNFIQEQRKIIANFKTQPWPMHLKIRALKDYKENLSKYTGKMNTLDTCRDLFKMIILKFYRLWVNIIASMTIGKSIIKHIEGRFGSSVASFFIFLRWLCVLNLLLTIVVILFIVLPQTISGYGLQVPESLIWNGSALSFIIDGEGYLFEYSILFYGYYDSGRNEPYFPPPHNPNPEIGWGYKLPLSYILTILALFVISIIAILLNMAEKYKFLQRASIKEQYLFAWKVFASWDHTITNTDTATSKCQHIAVALKETIMEAERTLENRMKLKFVLIRIITHSFVTIALLLSAYAIYLTVENINYTNDTLSFSYIIGSGWRGIWLFIQSFQVQAVIIVRNMVLPYLFQFAGFLEKHHPRTALKVSLVRLFCLYISSLYVLIISLFTLNRQCASDSINNSTIILSWLSHLNKRSINDTSNYDANNVICCWETAIGQELFKLAFTHLFAELVSIIITDFGRWLIVQSRLWPKLAKWIGLGGFDLAENILKLVYGQAVMWFGTLYCPILPAITFVKNIVLFYIRAVVVSLFNKPPVTMFRVASTKNFYMALMLLNAFLCIFPLGFAIMNLTPSNICGPFRGLSSMSDIITNEIKTWPHLIQTVTSYLTTATAIVPFIALLCIVIYIYYAKASAVKEVNKDLRLQLHLEQTVTKERIKQDAQNNEQIHRQELEGQLESKKKVNFASHYEVYELVTSPRLNQKIKVHEIDDDQHTIPIDLLPPRPSDSLESITWSN